MTSAPQLAALRVLDLGCGTGKQLAMWNVSPADQVVGVDIDRDALAIARSSFPGRTYQEGRGEQLPFPDESFDRVVSSVALPYMDIPKALSEIHRVLKSTGSVGLSLHPLSFTWKELRAAFPRPVALAFRCCVLANGVCFHLFGRAPGESFQTERGMRLALKRAGFVLIQFRRHISPKGIERLIAEAVKP
jgi:SAM-dependent methyltransferase